VEVRVRQGIGDRLEVRTKTRGGLGRKTLVDIQTGELTTTSTDLYTVNGDFGVRSETIRVKGTEDTPECRVIENNVKRKEQ